jgi:hypothetical protein
MTGKAKKQRDTRTQQAVRRNARARAAKFNPVPWTITLTIVMLGLVAAVGIVIPATTAFERQASDELALIREAFETYQTDTGDWPRHACQSATAFSSAYLAGYSCLYDNVNESDCWDGPYLCHVIPEDAVFVGTRPVQGVDPLDPWGNCYIVYRFQGGHRICILTMGADGTVNTDLDNIYQGTPAGDDQIVIPGA